MQSAWLLPLAVIVAVVVTLVVLEHQGKIMTTTKATNSVEPRNSEQNEEQIIMSVPEYNPFLRNDLILHNEEPVIKVMSSLVNEPNMSIDCDSTLLIDQLFSIDVETVIPICGKRFTVNRVERPENPHLSQLLTHVACLSRALQSTGNVLIMDGCMMRRSLENTKRLLSHVEKCTFGRWDVIVFSQNVHQWQVYDSTDATIVCKLLKSDSTSGYLVNAAYVSRLLVYMIQQIRTCLKTNTSMTLSDIFMSLQAMDTWIGFNVPIGSCNGSDVMYRYLDHAIDTRGNVRPVVLDEPFKVFSVLIYSNEMTSRLEQECDRYLFKGHHLTFQTAPVYHPDIIDKSFDYVFYVSGDARIYQHVPSSIVLSRSLMIVRNLTTHDISHRFHGGPTELYMNFCSAANKEEFVIQAATVELSNDYLYNEKCIYVGCDEPICNLLKSATPIIG